MRVENGQEKKRKWAWR